MKTKVDTKAGEKLLSSLERLQEIDYAKLQHALGGFDDPPFAVDIKICDSGCIKKSA
jgi:hypothetical protein